MNEPERFAARYREIGGDIDLRYVLQERRDEASYAPLISFFEKNLM